MAQSTNDSKETKTWPELAIGLYDKLTGRNAEITYEFDNFDLYVPSKVGDGSESHAHWKMNGTIKVRTTDDKNDQGGGNNKNDKNDKK